MNIGANIHINRNGFHHKNPFGLFIGHDLSHLSHRSNSICTSDQLTYGLMTDWWTSWLVFLVSYPLLLEHGFPCYSEIFIVAFYKTSAKGNKKKYSYLNIVAFCYFVYWFWLSLFKKSNHLCFDIHFYPNTNKYSSWNVYSFLHTIILVIL